MLYIVRGVPGSGKTTYSKQLGIFHVEADMFHMKDGEYRWDPKRVKRLTSGATERCRCP